MTELVREHRASWKLAAYDEDLPLYRNNSEWVIPADLTREDVPYLPEAGPVRVQFVVSDARVEPQYLVLVFEEVPEGGTLRAVQGALIRALADAPV